MDTGPRDGLVPTRTAGQAAGGEDSLGRRAVSSVLAMTSDPFRVLGLEPAFELDPEQVRKATLVRSARLHPDRAPDPITAAENASVLAEVNEAASTLLDDLARAEVMIRIHGGPGPSEDRTLPDGFLEDILATRLELEEAVARGDDVGKETLRSWAEAEWTERRRRVAALIDRDPAPGDVELREARREVNRWRYSQRMLDQIDGDASGREA